MRIMSSFLSGRYMRRAACILFLWGLLIIAALNFRSYPLHVEMPSPLTVVSSRLLLQKRVDSIAPLLTSTTENILDLTPFIDNSPGMTEDRVLEEVVKRLPSLPTTFWNKHKNFAMRFNKTCARLPSIYELEFNNIYWQTLHTSNGTFYLYGAYYDIRKNSRLGPTIRILGMINRIEPTVKTYCHIWFNDRKEPAIVRTFEYKYMWNKKWGNYKQGINQPYLIACQIPPKYHHFVPAAVSVVEHQCTNATNNLRVVYNKPTPENPRKDFAVCVKGLDFLHDDLSVRLVEWIELLNILGADKIFFYELQVHPNISKVLKHYEANGKVHVTPLTLPGGQPNMPAFQHLYLTKKTNHKRQNEIIPYNDCLYKNLYMYEYIVLLDIDEVIMPLNVLTWRELIDNIMPKALSKRNETKASYNVRNVYFLDDLLHSHGWFKGMPKYMHMLQHVYRSRNFTKPNQYVKCFHDPQRVLTLHNHFPLACLGSTCTSYPIETTDAQLQHYRADCVKTLKKTCEQFRENTKMDTAIWRYKDKLVPRAMATLKQLGFFSQSTSSISSGGGSNTETWRR